MTIDGYNVKLNQLLTYRYSNGNEIDLNGDKVPEGYCVFVNIKDCSIITESNRNFYDINNAPIIPSISLNHYCAIGKYKLRNSVTGILIDGNTEYQYYQAPVYFQKDGKVFVGSIRTACQ